MCRASTVSALVLGLLMLSLKKIGGGRGGYKADWVSAAGCVDGDSVGTCLVRIRQCERRVEWSYRDRGGGNKGGGTGRGEEPGGGRAGQEVGYRVDITLSTWPCVIRT